MALHPALQAGLRVPDKGIDKEDVARLLVGKEGLVFMEKIDDDQLRPLVGIEHDELIEERAPVQIGLEMELPVHLRQQWRNARMTGIGQRRGQAAKHDGQRPRLQGSGQKFHLAVAEHIDHGSTSAKGI